MECVADQTAPSSCPDTGNPCTVNVCDPVLGCVLENVPAGAACNTDICIINGTCNGQGACGGQPINIETACGESPEFCRAYGCDSELGCVLTESANEGLTCSTGEPCLMNETCTSGVSGGGAAVVCPDDNNVCTQNLCQAGLGCVYPAITVNPPVCSDNNNCTTDDLCVSGVCTGTLRDCAIDDTNPCQVGFCDVTVAEGCSVINFSGPYGGECLTPYPGICSAGELLCLDGALPNPPICQPLVSPGDKHEICDNGLDDNCNGVVDECSCVPDGSTPRYVNPAGTNAGDCTDINSLCQTIAYAISQSAAFPAVPGDTIILSAGTFLESNIVVDRNLHIFGRGQTQTIIDANSTGRIFSIAQLANASICAITATRGSIGSGGAIGNFGITTIGESTIRESSATSGSGGGIFNSGDLTLNETTVFGNISGLGNAGGGIYNNNLLTINNSTISGNSAPGGATNPGGGGICSNRGTVNITNSTISGNLAGSGSYGGGIYNDLLSTINIDSTTITINTADSGGGVYNNGISFSAGNSIIAAQAAGEDCVGTITNNGFNLNSDGTCTGFIAVPTFTLPALANNGGLTQTHALIPFGAGTQAIDTGNTTCGLSADQRGEFRPVDYPGIGVAGPRCDIGAFEVQAP